MHHGFTLYYQQDLVQALSRLPRTAGALVALALWWAGYKFLPVDVLFWVTLITTIAVTVVGAWTSNIMENIGGKIQEL